MMLKSGNRPLSKATFSRLCEWASIVCIWVKRLCVHCDFFFFFVTLDPLTYVFAILVWWLLTSDCLPWEPSMRQRTMITNYHHRSNPVDRSNPVGRRTVHKWTGHLLSPVAARDQRGQSGNFHPSAPPQKKITIHTFLLSCPLFPPLPPPLKKKSDTKKK